MTEYGRIHTDGSRSGGEGELLRIDVDDGKYTFIQRADGGSHVLRYSEPWLAELPVGSNCWLAMAYELQELRQPTQSDALQADALDFGNELIFACARLRHKPIDTEAIFSITWDGFPYDVTIRAAMQEK